jgi:hypothetical protein
VEVVADRAKMNFFDIVELLVCMVSPLAFQPSDMVVALAPAVDVVDSKSVAEGGNLRIEVIDIVALYQAVNKVVLHGQRAPGNNILLLPYCVGQKRGRREVVV